MVRMFKPQFASLVESGAKRQTVRPCPKRLPKVGQPISLREWTGKPYRSKQRVLKEAVITQVEPIAIDSKGIYLDGTSDSVAMVDNRDEFAKADGFGDFYSMLRWFEDTHGLPFTGILIKW